ncbi:CASP7 [Bugula neritina]|uniref:CASP7 n=1 Tax=Bugula neritina TaxID=10212 RepID=A0A7J7KDR3_BUGNE|nr:CASP7 [Bugula neritina]
MWSFRFNALPIKRGEREPKLRSTDRERKAVIMDSGGYMAPMEVSDMDSVQDRYHYSQYPDEHFHYELKRYKGYAVIINNVNFGHTRYRSRERSAHDVTALREMLQARLLFRPEDIQIEEDLTTNQMSLVLEKVASDVNFSEYSCLIVVVLSYGESENIVYGVDGKFSYQQLISPFQYPKIPTLFDTPKFFIIQSEYPENDGFSHNAPVPPPLSPSTEITEPDTLFLFSLDPASITWRTDGKGSHFIQRLCEVMRLDGLRYDITQMFVRVLRLVRLDYEGYVRDFIDTKLSCPRMVSLLSKEFRFDWEDY